MPKKKMWISGKIFSGEVNTLLILGKNLNKKLFFSHIVTLYTSILSQLYTVKFIIASKLNEAESFLSS